MASEQTSVNNRLILSAGTVKEKLHNWKREEMKLYKYHFGEMQIIYNFWTLVWFSIHVYMEEKKNFPVILS